MSDKYINKIAIVGAGGRFGKFITNALIDQGKHEITAITRNDSDAIMPKGVSHVKKVDYDSHSSLVDALTGQDALIITLKALTSPKVQTQLIKAAKDAGVQWIMPNEYGTDPAHSKLLAEDTRLGIGILAVRKEIEQAGLNWVGLSCGFWYEFSLAGTEARYGFDFNKKTLTLFDNGDVRIPTSTWPQAALAVARIFALPIQSDRDVVSLTHFRNRAVFVDSFFVSQRDMLASVLRVTGDREEDWVITSEPSNTRYERGMKMMKNGDLVGYVMLLYTRIFFPDGISDFTSKLNNKDLELPVESVDEATKVAIEIARA